MRAECCCTLKSTYYNEIIDVWEPLVEPIYTAASANNDDEEQYKPWEMVISVR